MLRQQARLPCRLPSEAAQPSQHSAHIFMQRREAQQLQGKSFTAGGLLRSPDASSLCLRPAKQFKVLMHNLSALPQSNGKGRQLPPGAAALSLQAAATTPRLPEYLLQAQLLSPQIRQAESPPPADHGKAITGLAQQAICCSMYHAFAADALQ